MLYLLLLFTLVPILELWLLFQISSEIGFWTTLALVLGTGMLGAALARWQGWLAMERVRREMRQGMLPAKAFGDGALILVAGVLLITPGVITDILGLALLVPPLRKFIVRALRYLFVRHVEVQTARMWHATHDESRPHPRERVVEAEIIDARVVDEDRDDR